MTVVYLHYPYQAESSTMETDKHDPLHLMSEQSCNPKLFDKFSELSLL